MLFVPAEGLTRPLAPELIAALMARGVEPLSVGNSVVATWTPHEAEAIFEQYCAAIGCDVPSPLPRLNFLELADGVDDETWLYHLRHGEYSAWFRDAIGDEELAEEVATVEREAAAPGVTPRQHQLKNP